MDKISKKHREDFAKICDYIKYKPIEIILDTINITDDIDFGGGYRFVDFSYKSLVATLIEENSKWRLSGVCELYDCNKLIGIHRIDKDIELNLHKNLQYSV